jgi:membrane-bound lytic murein transglycosylase D
MASGAFALSAADPRSLPVPTLEQAVPPSGDDLERLDPTLDLTVEPSSDDQSSGDPGLEVERDPWAEAFGEAAASSAAVTARVPDGSAYPVVVNDQVQHYIDRYTGNRREVVGLWLNRSGRYLGMIRDVFRAHGLPEDLAFVAMIESGFNPRAVSRAGAKGLWQFMAATARRYGLRVDHWVDERLDPEKSTTAAAAYLRDLHHQFGSWALAKAAYNAGEVKITRAIRAVGTTDFWTLARSRFLRRETKEFVPAIHAATLIGRDPVRYGFDLSEPEQAEIETIAVPPATHLRVLSAAAGMPFETLRAFNPVLIKGITPPGRPYDLRIPADFSERILAALAAKKRAGAPAKGGSAGRGGEMHVVQPGETVATIAQQHGVTVAEVVRWNNLESPDRIHPGERLRVAPVRLLAEPAGPSGSR